MPTQPGMMLNNLQPQLRSREVAALTLDDIDWKRDRLHIRGRKAGHSTVYPLAPAVGESLLDYLQHGRPKMPERALFFRAYAPFTQLSGVAVSLRAKCYLRKTGIKVARPGSHTLRHTCVQRLLDSGLSLKTIGDFVGHRTPDATKIYAKVNIAALREVGVYAVNDPAGPVEKIRITNVSSVTVQGPFHVLLDGLPAGRAVVNPDGDYMASPFMTLTSVSLEPGQTEEVTIHFNADPAGTIPGFHVRIISGNF